MLSNCESLCASSISKTTQSKNTFQTERSSCGGSYASEPFDVGDMRGNGMKGIGGNGVRLVLVTSQYRQRAKGFQILDCCIRSSILVP